MKQILIVLAAALAITAQAQDVTGAGATFPAPVYAKWADSYYKETNNKINYQSIGSGAGIKQIEASTVTFGASDMPLTDDKLATGELFQFPTVIGGVVPVVNIEGLKPGQLKLTGEIIADIYLGKIDNWKDSRIAALNPNVKLPDTLITPVHRADGSGTSFLFTNYLTKVSPEWKAKVGEGTAVNWPAGPGGKGNEGVSAFVGKLKNSIGYVEYAYVKQNKMTYVLMKNSSDAWVAPDDETFKAAASGANWDKTYFQVLTNQADKNAWPITGATFILVHTKDKNPTTVKSALSFFDWAFTKGDKAATDLDYVPLPTAVKDKIRQDWKKLGLF
jgi:phosphate transport system substrate-binding protein